MSDPFSKIFSRKVNIRAVLWWDRGLGGGGGIREPMYRRPLPSEKKKSGKGNLVSLTRLSRPAGTFWREPWARGWEKGLVSVYLFPHFFP